MVTHYYTEVGGSLILVSIMTMFLLFMIKKYSIHKHVDIHLKITLIFLYTSLILMFT
jgi:hypothetical protein